MTVIHVTDDNFSQEILQSDKPVLVDFHAAWCGPCKSMAPRIETLAQEKAEKIKVAKVDVEQAKETAKRYSVRALPTLMVFRDGEVIAITQGAKTSGQLGFFVEQSLALPAGTKVDLAQREKEVAADFDEPAFNEKFRRATIKHFKVSAAVNTLMGGMKAAAGIALMATSGSLGILLGVGLAAIGLHEMAIGPRLFRNAEKIINDAHAACDDITGETPEQKRARKAEIDRKWKGHFGLSFMQERPARMACCLLEFTAGAMLAALPAGFIANIGGILMGAGGFGALTEGPKTWDYIVERLPFSGKRKEKGEKSPGHIPPRPIPDKTVQSKSSLDGKQAATDFDTAAQKNAVPANEDQPLPPEETTPKKVSACKPPKAGP